MLLLQVLLNPLLRLRQSCCHPQAVRGQFIKLNKSTMTMEDLLEQMIKKVGALKWKTVTVMFALQL